jgi:two-component sensor histidine kinase
MTRDVTDRRHVESRLTASLREKEVLLREIHHRVKNNLQVIVSLLALQVPSGAGREVQQAFGESRSRILSMSLVHELLYQSKDLSVIRFDEYLQRLVSRIAGTVGATDGRIDVRVRAGDVHLDIDAAVPCGLIVNELVSNSFKHAFPGDRRGQVVVSLEEAGGSLVLVVEDDGVGIADAVQLDRTQTLGLQIVRSLTAQLRGTAEVIRGRGTKVRITFPAPAARAAAA